MEILKRTDLPKLRKTLYEKCDGVCPLCNQKIDYRNSVIDHNHTTKQVRGMICRNCNTVEGKLRNAFIRYGLKDVDYQKWVYNLSDYLKHEMNLIHPREVKPRKLKKSSYNKLKKYYTKYESSSPNFPEYPSSARMTKKLEKLFNEAHIEPEFY